MGHARRKNLQLAAIVLLTAVLGVNGYRTVRDGFVLWPQHLETRLRYQSALWDIGRHWLDAGTGRPPVIAENFFEPIDADSLRRSTGTSPEARWIQTGAGVAGALVWPLGQPAELFVPEYAPLDPALAEMAGLDAQPAFRSDGAPSFAIYLLPPEPAAARSPVGSEFGPERVITLEGLSAPVTEGNRLTLASWWVVGGDLPGDVAIFVHLVGEDGAIFAQYDGLDAAASTLRSGDAFLQRHVLELPESSPPGTYALRMGLYQRATGQRIPLSTGGDVIEVGHCRNAADPALSLDCSLTGIQ